MRFWGALIIRETLIKSTFYGEPAQLYDAGMKKIKVLAPLIVPQTFPHLFNQHFLRLDFKNQTQQIPHPHFALKFAHKRRTLP